MLRAATVVVLASTLSFSFSAVAQVAPAAQARSRAAATFAGRLTDAATGQPLPGANVIFPDLRQGTATDADGRFSFSNLPRGRFLMQVTSLGYNTINQTINTGSGQPLELKLTASATEIGQVVVTGVSQATELRRSPVPTTVIDRTRLNQTSATNVIDAIAHTPGVSQITTGAAISKPVVRGLGYNRVVTLNNGAKQEGQQWGDEHGIEIDEFSIDRAEIIKGPGSLLYGSDAMAGVINFLAPDPIAEGHITGSATANYQTNNRQQGYSLENAGNINGLNWLVRGTRKVAGSYQNRYDGRVFNSGFNEWDANGYVGLNKSWGYSHLTFSSFNQNIGLVEGARDSASGRFLRDVNVDGHVESRIATDAELRGYGLAVPRQQINHLRFGTDNNFIIGDRGGRLTLQVNYQQNLRREFGDALAPDEPQLYFQLRTVDYALRYFLPELSGWNVAVGTTGLRQQNRNLATEFLIPAYNMTEGGVFGLVKKSWGGLDLSGGLRYDVRRISAQSLYLDADERPTAPTTPGAETKFPGFVSTFNNYSGSLGAAYNLSDRLTVKANISRGFRAPNIAELGSNGEHEGTIRYEVGNANLQAETSLQVDAGVSYTSEHVRFTVDAFENSISNYIFARRVLNQAGTDSLVSTGPDVGLFNYVQGQARLLGGEVTLDFHPHPTGCTSKTRFRWCAPASSTYLTTSGTCLSSRPTACKASYAATSAARASASPMCTPAFSWSKPLPKTATSPPSTLKRLRRPIRSSTPAWALTWPTPRAARCFRSTSRPTTSSTWPTKATSAASNTPKSTTPPAGAGSTTSAARSA
jgi:iron complex outermembrane receptor protein